MVLEVCGILLMVLQAIIGTLNLFIYCIACAVALSQHGEAALVLLPVAVLSTAFHFGIYDAGAKLRKRRKAGVIFLIVASALAVGGSLLLIVVGLMIPEDEAVVIALTGLVAVLYASVMLATPAAIGLRSWNRLS